MNPRRKSQRAAKQMAAERHHYLYNGDILKMICHDGKWYERDQAVMWSPGNTALIPMGS